jgi:hypothetical protein
MYVATVTHVTFSLSFTNFPNLSEEDTSKGPPSCIFLVQIATVIHSKCYHTMEAITCSML